MFHRESLILMVLAMEGRYERIILVRFGELWLKSKNRGTYIKKLVSNIREQLGSEKYSLELEHDRIIIRPGKDANIEPIKSGLDKVFGISGYQVSYVTKPQLEEMLKLARSLASRYDKKTIFKINAHRSYKQLPFDSAELYEKASGMLRRMGYSMAPRGYDKELVLNATEDSGYVSIEKVKGLGGLPVGSGGKAVILLSGGIDSPVAAWYAMKRGMEPIYVHVHGFSSNEEASNSKLKEIVALLASYHQHYKIYYVPSHIFQVGAIRTGRYELIMMKVFMLLLAERIAVNQKCSVVFTGESLGQVASQTPENLAAEEHMVRIPVLRPLIGFDKEEIISVARRIGTYSYSILPYKDVCSINARNPKIKADARIVADISKEIKIKSIVSRSLKLSSSFST